MENLTLHNLDQKLKSLLQKQAFSHGRTIEEEALEIIRNALKETKTTPTTNLADTIQKRFAFLKDFEIPEIPRDKI